MTENTTKKSTPDTDTDAEPKKVEETPFEAVASICSVLVVGLFILTFLGQNMVIPSGSMQNTLLIGDHVLVDRITLAPPTKWMPLVHYREPQRGDVIVFLKPVPDSDPNVNGGDPTYLNLVKRLVGVPGDRLHLHDGVVYLNGVPQTLASTGIEGPSNISDQTFLDEFPAVPPDPEPGNFKTEAWALDLHNHVVDGDLVVPPGMYFMMGDNRHNSADSRFWGFVPRQNILGRPLFNYWSFQAAEDQMSQTGIGNNIAWFAHVIIRFIPDTRWSRTFKVIH